MAEEGKCSEFAVVGEADGAEEKTEERRLAGAEEMCLIRLGDGED